MRRLLVTALMRRALRRASTEMYEHEERGCLGIKYVEVVLATTGCGGRVVVLFHHLAARIGWE
jgi:hypothetical protein